MKNTRRISLDDAEIVEAYRGRITELRKTVEGQLLLDKCGVDYDKTKRRKSPGANSRFLAWDGEGYNTPDGKHHYILLGNSDGDFIRDKALSTHACFALFIDSASRRPNVVNIVFAGTYDVNMMLGDLPLPILRRIKDGDSAKWQGYMITFWPGKKFMLSKDGVTFTLWDVFSFFQQSFVKACRSFLGESEELSHIALMKEHRVSFTLEELDEIQVYCEQELAFLVRLMDELRARFHRVNIPLTKWNGPGAVADAVMTREGVRPHKADKTYRLPNGVKEAARYAYSGGRFEQFKLGRYDGKVYQYDIRSAYPNAIQHLPSLSSCQWTYTDSPDRRELKDFALYRVRYLNRQAESVAHLAQPHWTRTKNGNITFPSEIVENWIWGIELKAALRHRLPGARYYLMEGWELDDNGTRPFGFVPDMYAERAKLKRAGDGANVCLKLALNSLYGKTAQQRGWKPGKPLPKWHQLEWAGYITAATKAKLYEALALAGDSLIACETDSVFSTKPLDLPLSDNLGDWELAEYDGIIYLQSGVYWARKGDAYVTHKYRGFDPGTITLDAVEEWLCTVDPRKVHSDDESTGIPCTVYRFCTLGDFIGTPLWRTWRNFDRMLQPLGTGSKRIHLPSRCPACRQGRDFTVPHPLVPREYPFMSRQHKIAWIPDDYLDPLHLPGLGLRQC